MKISVITPVFNGEKYIEACIKNLADTSHGRVEHLIMDGGSSDRTVPIIKKMAETMPHIRWVSEKDKGQSDAMNKGIALASGEVVGFLNVDDFYESDAFNSIQRMLATNQNRRPLLFVANCNVLNENNELLYVNRPSKLHITDLLVGWNYAPHPVNPCAYFYQKSLHDLIGPYSLDEHFALDLDFIYRAVQVAKVIYVDETWGNFRFMPGTKTFEDQSTGAAHGRVSSLVRKYTEALPAWQRMRLEIKRRIFWRMQRFTR